jgi:hypothetical protein
MKKLLLTLIPTLAMAGNKSYVPGIQANPEKFPERAPGS